MYKDIDKTAVNILPILKIRPTAAMYGRFTDGGRGLSACPYH